MLNRSQVSRLTHRRKVLEAQCHEEISAVRGEESAALYPYKVQFAAATAETDRIWQHAEDAHWEAERTHDAAIRPAQEAYVAAVTPIRANYQQSIKAIKDKYSGLLSRARQEIEAA